ncbi:Hypothetical predicted protein [Marmota monax]|uniref:Uncharacterized protein n=1 Tax=Marmota monax TaxID=9995 RepID=A0A5E4A257_MARMO|nr:hypothetical protein GHT09_001110 [Marmota monax]VTJ51119.1 Hypothetical predicted protein [Marmota monax]
MRICVGPGCLNWGASVMLAEVREAGPGTAASSVARRPQLFPVSGGSGRRGSGDDLQRLGGDSACFLEG